MKREDIRIGMKVRIRRWNDMKQLYEIDDDGDINILDKSYFTQPMRHLCGRIATVEAIRYDNIKLKFEDESGDLNWEFIAEMVEPSDTLKSKLLNRTIVEHRDGSKGIVVDDYIIDLEDGSAIDIKYLEDDLTYVYDEKYDIMKINNSPICALTYKTWEWQREKESILDDAEKKYLSDVIRPFKKDVKHICKHVSGIFNGKAYIGIALKDNDGMDLPYFDKNTMYKNMKDDVEYTLKELGLDVD